MRLDRFITILHVAAFALLLAGCARSAPPAIVIVPGAWDSSASWAPVASALRSEGHAVTIVDLPVASAQGPRLEATLASYVDAVAAALPAEGAVVVAHSRSGAILAELAQRRPAGLRQGIFLAAYQPKAGESVYGLAMADAGSRLGPHLRPLAEGKALTVDPAGFNAVFGFAPATIPAEPTAPLGTPVGAGAGAVPGAVAIITTEDLAISTAAQRAMAQANGIRTVDLAAGHAPHVLAAEATAGLIHRLAAP